MSRLRRSLLLAGAVSTGLVGSVLPAAAAGTPTAGLHQTGRSGPVLFLANLDDDAGRCQAKARTVAKAAVEQEAAYDDAFSKAKAELEKEPDKEKAEREYQELVKTYQRQKNAADRTMAACNDAADSVVNGAQDAKDLARVRTVAWAGAPAGASGKVTVSTDRVRVFVKRAKGWEIADSLTTDEVRRGVELGIEGRDIVRDAAVWDGTAVLKLVVSGNGSSSSATVALKEAPVLTQLNTQRLQRVFAGTAGDGDKVGAAWRDQVDKVVKQSGVPSGLQRLDQSGDSWTQDLFEPAYMSIPGPGGKPQGMKVLLGSVNDSRRVGSRVIFTELAGADVAAVHVEHVPVPEENESYDSMGNLETIPATPQHPVGRIVIGGDGFEHGKTGPASEMTTLLKSQGMQNPLGLDTSWLTVGHVDEFLQFVPVPGSRLGWKALIADPAAGLQLLRGVRAGGHGGDIMHGRLPELEWPYDLRIDQRSTDEFLADKQFVETNERAVAKIQANVEVLKREAGLTDADLVRVPSLFTAKSMDYGMLETEISQLQDGPEKDAAVAKLHAMRDAVAEIPGAVNGLVLNAGKYIAPKPYGPVVGGKDVFATAISKALAGIGYQVTYADDLKSEHISEGEIHCATNTLRDSLSTRWWN
ncbi:protein-arginine deiminase family protein [Kribbella sp. NPDC051770]|uniref:protein-arginine deiminase family protein n=1 Tax=Kribbella sp. NPDC051770 TaxID=3155413 RepID=UPI00341F98FC